MRKRVQDWLDSKGSAIAAIEIFRTLDAKPLVRRFSHLATRPYITPADIAAIRSAMLQVLATLDPAADDTDATREKSVDPAEVAALRARARVLMKERSLLKGRLIEMTLNADAYSDEDRYKLAHEIVSENVRDLDEVYTQIRNWDEKKIPPTSAADRVRAETVEIYGELLRLRPEMSVLRKKLAEAPTEAEKAAINTQMEQKQARIDEITDFLNL